MDKIISIEFLYRKKVYYALVRTKIFDQETAYCVTIMNGDLERLWYGHHIIGDEKKFMHSQQTITNNNVAELRRCVATALWQRLRLITLNNDNKYQESYEQ